MLQFSNRKAVQALFYPRDVFCHPGVLRLEFFVNLSDHQLGVTPNQDFVGRQGGRHFEPDQDGLVFRLVVRGTEPEQDCLLDLVPGRSSQLQTNARLRLSGRPVNIESPPIQIVEACFRLGEFRYEII